MTRSLCVKVCAINYFLLVMATAAFSQTIISLSGKNISLKHPKFYISEIIDSRSNKEIVGLVQRGLKNRQETARLENGFQDELKTCLADFLQPGTGLTPLLIRILKLNVYERTLLNSETATAELIVEFYTSADQGVTLVKSAGSTVTSKGIDVTHAHGKNVARCLVDCLSQVNAVLNQKAFNTSPTIEHQKLFETPIVLEEYHYPILKDTFLVKGVYRNFISFGIMPLVLM